MSTAFAAGLFKGVVAIVTGGGTGIGRATAFELGRLGASLAICGRRIEPLKQTADDLQKENIPVFYDTCDIRSSEATEAFVKKVLAKYSRIDILVNNAGGQFPTLAENLNEKGFTAVVRNNLIGTWNMTSAVGKLAMIPQQSGCIINVIAQIIRGFPGMVHTGAARAGVDNMTKTLSVEWAPYNIRVNAVAPGVIKSSGTNQYGDAALESSRQNIPAQRLGTVDEVAWMIAYMASQKLASFITGQTFYIDGGQSIHGDLFSFASHRQDAARAARAKL